MTVGHLLERGGACAAPLIGPMGAKAPVYRVLLVEDDDIDAKLIGLCAEAIDGVRLDIERVMSSSEARTRLAAGAFDLCILDFWLGCESSIRFLAELGGTPALVLTSLSTPDIRQMCATAGAAVFLGKADLSAKSLRGAVLKVLECAKAFPLTAAVGSTKASPSKPDRIHMPGRLDLSMVQSMTETVRFGMFESFWADRFETDSDHPIELWEFILGAVESARSVLEERGQTLCIRQPETRVFLSRDRAGLFFLLFEVLGRASRLSAPNSKLTIGLAAGEREIRINLQGGPRIDSTAGALALGPLCTQLLSNNAAVFSDNTDPDGRFLLTIRLAVESDAAAVAASH